MTPTATQPASPTPPTPALWITGGLLCGQMLAPHTPGSALPFAAAIAALYSLRSPLCGARHLLLAIALLAAAFGHIQLDRRLQPNLTRHHVSQLSGDTVRLRGQITERPVRRPSGLRFVYRVDAVRHDAAWKETRGRVSVTLGDASRVWRAGDRLSMRLRLRLPRAFGNPGEFDYASYLARRRIYATGFATDDGDWRRLPPFSPPSTLQRWRQLAAAVIEEVLAPDLQPIAAALVLGEGAALPSSVRQRYARAGVSHVLAVSGLHVGLVATAAYAAARWLLSRSDSLLLRTNVPKLASAASAIPVAIYALLAQGSVATWRAATMAGLIIGSILLDRPRDWLVGLAIAAFAINLVAPGSLFEASFQLSFVAVLAIILGGRRLNELYTASAEARLLRLHTGRRAAIERWLVLSQGITLCAVLGTAPLVLYHFHRLSLIGVLSNIAVVPLLGLLTVGVGLIATLAVPVAPGLGAGLFALAGIPLRAGDWLVDKFAALPGTAVHPTTPSNAELLTIYTLLAASLVSRRRIRVVLLVIGTALALGLGAAAYHERWASPDLRLEFLSVGQGDSTLVRFPGGHTMLVDGGGLSTSFDVGERVIAPYLWRNKIHRLSTVVLSHPDFDHYGGLASVVDAFAPEEFWHSGASAEGSLFANLRRALHRRQVTQIVTRRGFRRRIGGVAIEVRHPGDESPQQSNDQSLTIRLRYGPVTILLPGDLEAAGESILVAQPGDMRSTILKVPHHGSRTSSSTAFLERVQPRVAIISSGFRNRFALPHPEVVTAYRDRGISIWRTDRDGAVRIRIRRSGHITVGGGRRFSRHLQIDPAGELVPTEPAEGPFGPPPT